MYCTSCGAELVEGNTFCTNCGAPVKDAGTSVSGNQAVNAEPQRISPSVASGWSAADNIGLTAQLQQSAGMTSAEQLYKIPASQSAHVRYFEARRKADEHASAAAEYRAYADDYQRSLKHCKTAGKIVGSILAALGLIVGVGEAMEGVQNGIALSVSTYIPAILLGGFAYGVLGFFFPYGFGGMHHWIKSHSFIVFFNLILMIFAAAFAFMAAPVVGPLYWWSASRKIKKARAAEQQEQQLADKYEAQVRSYMTA